ncbi:MAG TPA: DEAD/DEAH box helicase, partial [Desulfobacterales bacterium]|nr:DEAD/DEAH box helicase [Desulfobacterales bacterium]
ATASGKTEAVCAPLIERFLDLAKPWTILYVSPTRALVNDLYARLEIPLQRLNLILKRRTGEYRGDVKEVPNILLTTPESFDSLLCRGRRSDSLGHVLSAVVALVLDEVHLLFGTPRGEQVRYLVERLRRLRREAKLKGWASSDGFQTIGLSATIPDPDAVLSSFIPQGRAIVVPGGREIDVVTMPGEKLNTDDTIPAYLASCAGPQKLLVFSNSRRRVDDLALRLTPKLRGLGYKVEVHHGSLPKNQRVATEEMAKKESRVVIFATSTLELGIDIGDIDLVVLDEPPPDVPALLQRIGRGNRRSDQTRLMICPRSRAESIIHSAMIDAARDGWLGPSEYGPHYAVARQQIASYIFQSRRRSRTRNKLLGYLECLVEPFIGRSILDHMVETGELKEDAEGIRLGEEWEERATYGKIHSNIEDNPG